MRACVRGDSEKAAEEKVKVRRIPAIVLESFASEGAIVRPFEEESSKG